MLGVLLFWPGDEAPLPASADEKRLDMKFWDARVVFWVGVNRNVFPEVGTDGRIDRIG